MVTRDATGTAQYKAPNENFGLDVFGLSSPSQYAPVQSGIGPARLKLYKTKDPKIIGGRIEVYECGLGVNHVLGRFDQTHAGFARSTLDSRFRETLTLPLITSSQAINTSGASNLVTPWANGFGTMLMATGKHLYKETSTTDPTLVETPITASVLVDLSNIVSLSNLYIGDVTSPRVVVGRLDGPAAILIDISVFNGFATWGTTTFPFWGAAQTPINNNAIISYIGTTLCSTQSNEAVNYSTNPTVIRENVPAGGYVMSSKPKSLGGRPLRIWLNLPEDNSAISTGALAFGRTTRPKMTIHSYTMEGQDPQPLDGLGLKTHLHTCDYRDGWAVSDEDRVMYHGGRIIRDTRIFANREPNSDRELKVRGLGSNGPELLALVTERSSSLGTGVTAYWRESYDYDLDAWHQISEIYYLSDAGDQIVLSPGGTPLSRETGFAHLLTKNGGVAHRQYIPPYGTNTFNLRKTAGAQTSTGREYTPTGVIRWNFQIPGLEGQPKVVSRIISMSDVDAGGANAYQQITAGGKRATFRAGQPGRHKISSFTRNNDFFYDLDIEMELGRTTTGTDASRYTPNGLPFAVEFFCRLDDLPMPANTNWDSRR